MKNCPFCKELIQDDAIKCRFCGEFITSSEILKTGTAISEQTETRPPKKGMSRLTYCLLFSVLGLIAALIFMPFNGLQPKAYPITRIIFAALSMVSISWAIKNLKKKTIFSGILALSIPFLLISLINLNDRYDAHKKYLEIEKTSKAEMEKKEKEKRAEIQFNQEHKEEHYQKALAFYNEKKYTEAKAMFSKVMSIDGNYKDSKRLFDNINETVEKIEKDKLTAEAQQKLTEAAKLLNSKSCNDFQSAIDNCNWAIKYVSDSKKAKDIILKSQIKKLSCYEGNAIVQMAVQILDYQPLKLHVWVKNVSGEVRHANPNHFTLVTVTGISLSVSTETYGLSNYFNAVDLQPGTETSGSLIFDTYDKPKKLVYSELLGTSISREFPYY